MRQRFNTCVATLAALFALSLAARTVDASLLYYESFTEASYPTAYLGSTPDNGNTWFASKGTPNNQIIDTTISSGNALELPGAGGALQFLGNDDTRGLSALSGGGVGADDTTIYASFLLNVDGATAAFTGLEFWNGAPASGNANRSVRAGAFNTNYEVTSDVSGATGSAAFTNNTTHFVVLKFNYAAGPDTVDVFIDPTNTALQNNTYTAQLAGANFAFDRVGLTSHNDAPTSGFLDEIRIGTDLTDVADATIVSPPPSRTILIDLGKSTDAFTTDTPDDTTDTWNNFNPVAGGTNSAINPGAGTLTNMAFSDGVTSNVDFALTAGYSGGQGIGAADWSDDFSGTVGYPVSATRDTFYANALNPGVVEFTFSDLDTDGTVYDLSVFGALDPSIGDRPNTIIRVNGVDMTYDPNDPGQVTFTDLLPDINGQITFSVYRANSTGAAHINVVTLTAVTIPEPATFAMVMLTAPMLIRRRQG